MKSKYTSWFLINGLRKSPLSSCLKSLGSNANFHVIRKMFPCNKENVWKDNPTSNSQKSVEHSLHTSYRNMFEMMFNKFIF